VELGFLVLLRSLALVAPLYILLKGKRIARVINGSLVAGWSLYTAWHVCYFVYLWRDNLDICISLYTESAL
jgi:hypothetical protein